ncbi:TPA: PHP domain-containing protein, partial [Candidatus Bathyarchaeota archaeon]|nr:PHP domain-containing protein [Candidatus Bathyarchaeota archaeon]
MRLKVDLHVHTTNSKDGHIPPKLLPKLILLKGLDGVAVTDHGVPFKLPRGKALIIPGIEVATKDGHLVALGVEGPIQGGLPAVETAEKIRESSGLIVIPHPYDFLGSSVNPFKLKGKADAIETVNSSIFTFSLSKFLAERAAIKLNLPAVAGSDAHVAEALGDAYTLIESPSKSVEDVLEAIKKGRTTPYGKATP